MSVHVIRVLTRLGAGGPPIHCLIATREMQKLGYETKLVIGRRGPADGDMSYLVRPEDPIATLDSLTPHSSVGEDLRAMLSLWRLFRRERPQIVHTHTARAGAVGRVAAWLAGVPVIVHTYHGHVLKGYFPPLKTRLFRVIEKWLARLSDAVCVLAPQQARELGDELGIVPQKKLRIVHLGMDLQPFANLPDAPSDGPIHIGWLGRFVPIKNIPLLISVIDRFFRAWPQARFLIAGDGPEQPLLIDALPRWGGRVEWLGWVENVAPVIARCHLLLQTSKREGTPVSLIQGMAARRPFVATPAGGLSDMGNGGRNGILCPPDAAEIVQALIALATDVRRRREMGICASAFAQQQFSATRLTASLDALYRELLAARSRVFDRARTMGTV